jgi:WD40 repeat protein
MRIIIHFTVCLLSIILIFFVGQGQGIPQFPIVSWSPTLNLIAIVKSEDHIEIVDSITGSTVYSFATGGLITSIDWSYDSQYLAGIRPIDGKILIWDTIGGKLITQLSGKPSFNNYGLLDWHPTQYILVSVATELDGGAPLEFWQMTDNSFSSLPIGYPVSAYDLSWNETGDHLAVVNVHSIYIFENPLQSMTDPQVIPIYGVYELAWTSNNRQLIAYSIDGSINFVNIDTSLIAQKISAPPRKQQEGVATLRWLNTNYFVYSTWDGLITLVDGDTGQVLNSWNTQLKMARNSLTISPFGAQIFIGGFASESNVSQIQSQLIVPIATLDRFAEIATSCGAPTSLTAMNTSLQSETAIASEAQQLESHLDTLPEGTIPASCEADLRAITQAIVSEQNSR